MHCSNKQFTPRTLGPLLPIPGVLQFHPHLEPTDIHLRLGDAVIYATAKVGRSIAAERTSSHPVFEPRTLATKKTHAIARARAPRSVLSPILL